MKLREGETKNNIPNCEIDAVNVEIQVKKVTCDPKRTTYGGKEIPKEDLQ